MNKLMLKLTAIPLILIFLCGFTLLPPTIRLSIPKIIEGNNLQSLQTAVENATKDDVIYIYSDSWGGSVAPTFKLIKAIKNSKAKQIISVVKEATSAASDIVFNTDKIYFKPGGVIGLHYGSSGGVIFTAEDLERDPYLKAIDTFMREQQGCIISKRDWAVIHTGNLAYYTEQDFKNRCSKTFQGRLTNMDIIDRILELVY